MISQTSLMYADGFLCRRFFLRDTKSSHGTYINDERLSDKGRESEPCELKSGDIVVSRVLC